ncbi:MAG TPA: DUF2059 domain-containing protein [Rhizomicrobium sp.]
MYKSLAVLGALLLLSTSVARAQAPSSESMEAARKLVVTLRLPDQYRALLPGILLGLKRPLTQDRPEIERDFDALVPTVIDTYAKYYNGMVDDAAALYAKTFSADELRAIEAFYRSPAGQKYMLNSRAIAEQTRQIGEESSRKAADDLKARMTQALREKGHKF